MSPLGPPEGYVITDEGKRLSDIVNQAIVDGRGGKWVAARLSDGGTDGVFYDTRAEAVEHQLHWQLCSYLRIPRLGGTMSHAEATSWLTTHRAMYDAGFRMTDPERAVILPVTNEQRAMVTRLARRAVLEQRGRAAAAMASGLAKVRGRR